MIEDLAPHVAIKLKRWFPRVDAAAARLRISATGESSEELRWFCERFPLEISARDAAVLERRAAEHLARRAAVLAILDGRAQARSALPMAFPPRKYQAQAAALCHATGNLLLTDDVGLGKTVSAISLLAIEGCLPAVVVVPSGVLEQWSRSISRFLPEAKVYTVRTSVDGEPKRGRVQRASADVVLVTYTRLFAWREELNPRAIVFDEAHALRHDGTGKYLAALEVASKADTRLMLTATPIFNYGGEFFNLFGVLAPGALGERPEFLREWCTTDGGDKHKVRDPVAFGAWLREQGLMLRRSRRDVARELPPIVRSVVSVECSDSGDSFAGLESIAWRALHGSPKSTFLARGELDMKLRHWTGVSKARAVAAFVAELIESTGEPVLLAGWHHDVYAIWLDALAAHNPAMFTGHQDAKAKDAAAQALIRGESKVLIMSLRSGEGLDGLQAVCHHVVYGEFDWSPAVHEQFTGRIHRDGQDETTMEYWCAAEEGSDPVILDALGVKRWQLDGVVDPQGERTMSIQTDPEHIRKLAEALLRKRGKDPSKPPPGLTAHADASESLAGA